MNGNLIIDWNTPVWSVGLHACVFFCVHLVHLKANECMRFKTSGRSESSGPLIGSDVGMMGKTVLLRWTGSFSSRHFNTSFVWFVIYSFYSFSRIELCMTLSLTLYGGTPLRRFRCERGIRSRGRRRSVRLCLLFTWPYFSFMLKICTKK